MADFSTVAQEEASFEAPPNPRRLDTEAQALRERQHGLSVLPRLHAKVAARRRDCLHKLTARIAAHHRLITTEALSVRNMTASTRSTLKAPGRRAAQKAGLTAPGAFLNMLRYEAEKAGSEFLEAITRRLKPPPSNRMDWWRWFMSPVMDLAEKRL